MLVCLFGRHLLTEGQNFYRRWSVEIRFCVDTASWSIKSQNKFKWPRPNHLSVFMVVWFLIDFPLALADVQYLYHTIFTVDVPCQLCKSLVFNGLKMDFQIKSLVQYIPGSQILNDFAVDQCLLRCHISL